jgi:hypothetical protein
MNAVVVIWRRACVGVAVLGMLFAGARSAEATSIIEVSAVTAGCFGTGCSVFTSAASSPSSFALTLSNSTFDVFSDASGSATNILLGTLTRANQNVSSDLGSLNFSLRVTFTLPVGLVSNSGTFTATVAGTNSGGGGAESVNFNNNTQTFVFSNAAGSGSFNFAVSNDPSVAKGSSATILGVISNATFTPAVTTAQDAPAAVPEPTTMVLLGTGLVAAVIGRRRLAAR